MSTSQGKIIDYEGTPEEVGAQLFADALGPTISAVAQGGATDRQVARLMAGIMAGLAGTVAENFGPQAAVTMLRGTADNVERSMPAVGGSLAPH